MIKGGKEKLVFYLQHQKEKYSQVSNYLCRQLHQLLLYACKARVESLDISSVE